MNVKPGEKYIVDGSGARMAESLYPELPETHSVDDLVADNARLRRRIADMLALARELAEIVNAEEAATDKGDDD